MKMSRRAKRMDRHHKRNKSSSINLVSLMDIFTILVFFLLVNSSEVEVLPSTKEIKLPESIAEKKPKETLVIVVNDSDISIRGKKLVSVSQVLNSSEPVIENLRRELMRQAEREKARLPKNKKFKGQITIMGDKEIPYSLLKKIMLTCTKSRYTNISLAVVKKLGKAS